MPKSWSDKRERQYEHIKEGLEQRGKSEAVAEEIAARTVNKERAQHGEAKEASRSSIEDMPASRRGGLHAHSGERGRTYEQLYHEAQEKGLKGRSTMSKAELEKKLSH
jgi:plasmid stabilization system protein ParE